MIDLEDLMTHSFEMKLQSLDKTTKNLILTHKDGDYALEMTINVAQMKTLKQNMRLLHLMLK